MTKKVESGAEKEVKAKKTNKADTSNSELPLKIIAAQRILDNIMVPVYFENDCDDAKEALEVILRTILDDSELVVEEYHTEYVLSNVGHHGVRIDVWAKDGNGRQIATELQKGSDEEIFPRALFEAATMIVHSLPQGMPYTQIDKVAVIFFADKDPGKKGKALYRYEFSNDGDTSLVKNYSPVCLFVNGTFRDSTEKIGRVIADIMETDPAKMTIPILRDRMAMLKNTKEGQEKMESALQEYLEEYASIELKKARMETEKIRVETEKIRVETEKIRREKEIERKEKEAALKETAKIRQDTEEVKKKLLFALIMLVKARSLSLDKAAEYAGISPDAFKATVDLHT